MATIEDYGKYETAWCPGCGNFGILASLKRALAEAGIEPHQVIMVSGIGQAAKGPHYLSANVFNGLHGRSLPVATAAKLANHHMVVIAQSGDGCHYGEGGNHFLHALRRNIDITILAHDNKVYGLTKGQASPTSDRGFYSKAQPLGAPSFPFRPLAVAVAMQASFVARGYAGDIDHLSHLIKAAIQNRGTSLVDILQPCVSFNRQDTWQFYNQRVKHIPDSYDPFDWEDAMKKAMEWGDNIPIGIIYRSEKPAFEDMFPALTDRPLIDQQPDPSVLKDIMMEYA